MEAMCRDFQPGQTGWAKWKGKVTSRVWKGKKGHKQEGEVVAALGLKPQQPLLLLCWAELSQWRGWLVSWVRASFWWGKLQESTLFPGTVTPLVRHVLSNDEIILTHHFSSWIKSYFIFNLLDFFLLLLLIIQLIYISNNIPLPSYTLNQLPYPTSTLPLPFCLYEGAPQPIHTFMPNHSSIPLRWGIKPP